MKKKRITFLLGAGAALPWGGPTTAALTKSINNLNKITTSSSQNVTQFLFDQLEESYHQKKHVNFETVISLILPSFPQKTYQFDLKMNPISKYSTQSHSIFRDLEGFYVEYF